MPNDSHRGWSDESARKFVRDAADGFLATNRTWDHEKWLTFLFAVRTVVPLHQLSDAQIGQILEARAEEQRAEDKRAGGTRTEEKRTAGIARPPSAAAPPPRPPQQPAAPPPAPTPVNHRIAAMADYGMRTNDLGSCVRLIEVLQRNLPALGIERGQFDTIYVEDRAPAPEDRRRPLGGAARQPGGPGARRSYTVLITGLADNDRAALENIVGTHITEATAQAPSGDCWSINELMERVLLVREPRPTAANGLILALLGTNPRNVDLAAWHRELGRLGCRGVRVGCMAPQKQDISVLYLIEIAKPPPNFAPPEGWGSRRALVFHRLRPDASCPFYMEWGYAHPVRELPRLYRISDERLVLMAADALERPRGEGGGGPPHTRVSLTLREADWRASFDLPDQIDYAIESTMDLDPRTLDAATETAHASIAVEVRREPTLGSTASEIESKIAWHQQAIEQLRQARQRNEIERQEPVYLVQMFEQFLYDPANGEDSAGAAPGRSGALPAGFVRFLDRPYTELANFRYGFFEDPARPGIGLHVVLDERPGSYERVWTDLATESFVAPQRWWDLGVRLFIRAGDTLYPYIEDESLMLRLRDELWRHGGFSHDQPLLLRWHPGEAGEAPYTDAICLAGMRPLLDPGVFRLLGTRFDMRVPEFHVGTRDDMLQAQRDSVRSLNELADTLESEIVEAVADRVATAEAAWTVADDRVQQVEQRLAAHIESASQIDVLLNDHSRAWEDMVDNVLEADSVLSHRKIEALTAYAEQHAKRAEAIERHRAGLEDTNQRLAADLEGLQDDLETIAALGSALAEFERELPREIAAVDAEAQTLAEKLAVYSTRQRQELDAALATTNQLESQLGELRQMKLQTQAALRQAEKLRAEIERESAELAALQDKYDAANRAAAAASDSRDMQRAALRQSIADVSAAIGRVLSSDIAALQREAVTQQDREQLDALAKQIANAERERIEAARVAEQLAGLQARYAAARQAAETATKGTTAARAALLQEVSDTCGAFDRVVSADQAARDRERASLQTEVDRLRSLVREVEDLAKARSDLAQVGARAAQKKIPMATLGGAITPLLLQEIRARLP